MVKKGITFYMVNKPEWTTKYYGQITPDGKIVLHRRDSDVGQLRSEILHVDNEVYRSSILRANGKPLVTDERRRKIYAKLKESLVGIIDVPDEKQFDDTTFMKAVYELLMNTRFKKSKA